MRRVLAVIHTSTFGGPHNQILQLYESLRFHGWELTVVMPDEAGNAHDILGKAGIPILSLPLRRLRRSLDLRHHGGLLRAFPSNVRDLRQIIRRTNPHVVQVCGLSNPHAAIAAHLEAKPVVWQFLSDYPPYALRLALSPLYLTLPDVVMTTGRAIGLVHPGVRWQRRPWVPFFPPVDTSQFYPRPERKEGARAALGLKDDAFVVGTVGNRTRQKAHHFLVDALTALEREHPNMQMCIIGSPVQSNAKYYLENVVGPARARGLLGREKLQFANPTESVANFLPAFDVFALTSEREGFPTVILEAMAAGIPVVASAVGAVPEVVRDRTTGMTFTAGSTPALCGAISELVADAELRKRLARDARSLIERQFDLNSCTASHVRAYELAIEHRGRRSWRSHSE